jgi:hypothetical protein
MNLQVQYDRSLKIGAVGPSVWAKLGPEDWFDNYKIVSANSREYHADFVLDLGFVSGDIKAFTTQDILDTAEFKDLAVGAMADYRFIIYKPLPVPDGLSPARFIANDILFARFENKRIFREVFGSSLPIPRYVLVAMGELIKGNARLLYEQFSKQFASVFVVQDEQSGGGRGTFIIRSSDDMQRALDVLVHEKKGDMVIVSEFIDARECSVQVFVGGEITVPGSLQQQLVRNTELLNPDGRGGMFFCGGRLVDEQSSTIKKRIESIIHTTSTQLRDAGYKGIYGIDFLIDEHDDVFVLEINARTTGLLPLINEQATPLPIYLLHVLELAGEDYVITDTQQQAVTGPQSFVVLFNKANKNIYFDEALTTGNYQIIGDRLEKIDERARWNADADVMLQLFCSSSVPAKPNLKLCNIFLKGAGFDTSGVLLPETRAIVEIVQQHQVRVDS